MGKLDPVKLEYIVRAWEKGELSTAEIATQMGVSVRRVQQVCAKSRAEGSVPSLGRPGRPKAVISDKDKMLVEDLFRRHPMGAVRLERLINATERTHIPHNTIHKVLVEKGLAVRHPRKNSRRKWVRYEREFSNSMWHTDYKLLDDGRWFIAYQDDASRFIVGFGVFNEATGAHAIEVLAKAIEAHGSPASILTDRGSQFYANESEVRQRGESEFEKELVRRGIRHILCRVNHPQTNGKLERFHGELQRKLKWFDGVDSMVKWYNYDRPHDSLDQATLETPARAFARKMPEPGQTVTDKDSREVYHAS